MNNEEFNQFWENKDNRKLLCKILHKYKKRFERGHSTKVCKNALFSNSKYIMWSAARSYKKEHPSKAKFTTWLYIVASNWCKCYFSKIHKQTERETSLTQPIINSKVYNNNSENLILIKDLFEKLPQKHKNILRQRYLENRTLKEIGENEGFSIERARQKVNKALLYAREILK